jgi:hypothetical protein
MRMLTVAHKKLAKTTNVLTHAPSHVDRVLTALFKTMSPSADVQGELLGILSGAAAGSHGQRSALPVEPTLTVRLDQMTDPSADVSKHTLEIH